MISQRSDKKRGFVFSRYGGWGNHRYPGFFTGDTHSEWAVLKYEIPFTARGGNTLTPYITHDIGGFLGKKFRLIFMHAGLSLVLLVRYCAFTAHSKILKTEISGCPGRMDRKESM